MSAYTSDRAFTDYIHRHLALDLIYTPIHWTPVDLDAAYAEKIDMQQGIDYIFKDKTGNLKTVQERFREVKYQKYSDFTIRYRRDGNMHQDRKQSEYYKMKADYFTYGITNCHKNTDLNRCTDFVKYAIIDLKKVYEKIDAGEIIIRDNGKNFCSLKDRKIICPIKYNHDGSSSFFPIEIAFLVQLWGKEIILSQKGFI